MPKARGPLDLGGNKITSAANGSAATDVVPLGQADGRYAQVFSPIAYGAAGNGIADDTSYVQAAAAAAVAAKGVIDLGTYTFKTSSPVSITTNFHMRGAGYSGGTIVNSASDLFTVGTSANLVTFEGCNFTSNSGGGHIWNAGTGSMSFWKILGCQATQNNAGKSIWNQTGGAWIDCLVDQQCFFTCSGTATVSPWSVAGVAGNFNSVKFTRMRCLSNGAGMPFFNIDPGSAAGWNEEIVFDHITFEVTTGGAIAMTGAIDVQVSMCSLWDIPAARTDTGCATFTSTAVTDAAAATGDLYKAIAGPGIPSGTTILGVTAGTGYVISKPATATASGLAFTVGGPAANQYSFTRSAAGYPCRGIQVRGGRATGNASGTAYADFYADTFATNILLDSFGTWGVPPVITSPSAQTTIINPVVAGTATPVASIPAAQLGTPLGASSGGTGAGTAAQNTVLAGPAAGGTGAAAFRPLTAADIPWAPVRI